MSTVKTNALETQAGGTSVLTIGTAAQTIKLLGGSPGLNKVLTSDATGGATWQAPAAVNTPYFYAYLVTDVVVTDATWTKVPCNTVSFESGSTYDESVNYRFTPAVSGKYFIYGQAQCRADTASKLAETRISIYKNGSDAVHTVAQQQNENTWTINTPTISAVLDMNTTDYVELWTYMDVYTGTARFYGAFNATHFMAYKLID